MRRVASGTKAHGPTLSVNRRSNFACRMTIYAAAVYYYAVVGKPPVDFDGDLIRGAFTRKDA